MLTTVEANTFYQCESLKSVEFPEGLHKICWFAFYQSGLEKVEFPTSLRRVGLGAFAKCTSLRSAKFGEGLEVLGEDKYYYSEEGPRQYAGVFYKSALETVVLPSTLRRIEYGTFSTCGNLRSIVLPDRLEYLGVECFQRSALESVMLPPALNTVSEGAF